MPTPDKWSWLPLRTQSGRRTVLAIAGLGLITALSTAPAVAIDTTGVAASAGPVTQATEAHSDATTTPNDPADGKPATKDPAVTDKPAVTPPKTAAKPEAKAPTDKDLMPVPVTAPQQSFTPSAEQVRNAEEIVKVGEAMKLPPRAQVIAVATALQESTLHNYGHLGARNDHDSQGLFQQRPSAGWGSPEQITKPDYAATKFYQALMQVNGWDKMPLTVAAQTVQVSAFPDHYAKWEKMAADLVRATHGTGPYAEIADKADKSDKDKKSEKNKADKSDKDQKADEKANNGKNAGKDDKR